MLYLELLAVILLTLLNGLLAMSEMAVVSSRKSRLESLADQGSRGARKALSLIDEPGRFLSTVQIGITLVGVVAGAFSGATLGHRLGGWLNGFAAIAPYGQAIGIGLTLMGITYLSLIVGELVPKRIALTRPERIAALAAGPMSVLSLMAAPAVWLLHVSTEGIMSFLGLSGSRETTVTEDEVKSLIAEGTQAGVFAPQEQEMIEGVLRLADRSVRLIMTPRSRIIWIDLKSDRNAILDMAKSNRFSRLLVCDGTIDRPVGVVHTKNLLPEALSCAEVPLSSLLTPVLFVPEKTSVLSLLNRFKNDKIHVAIAVDEYGSTEGLVTLADILEAIAGDLPESGEEAEPGIVQREDGSWLVDGTFPTDLLEAATGIDMGREVQMTAGFVLEHLSRIPKAGESFRHENAVFEVLDMDGNRIDKVLITRDRGRTGEEQDNAEN